MTSFQFPVVYIFDLTPLQFAFFIARLSTFVLHNNERQLMQMHCGN